MNFGGSPDLVLSDTAASQRTSHFPKKQSTFSLSVKDPQAAVLPASWRRNGSHHRSSYKGDKTRALRAIVFQHPACDSPMKEEIKTNPPFLVPKEVWKIVFLKSLVEREKLSLKQWQGPSKNYLWLLFGLKFRRCYSVSSFRRNCQIGELVGILSKPHTL